MAEKKAFDGSKAGVKGLADSGIKELPPIFHAPPHLLNGRPVASADDPDFTVPVIDLEGATSTLEKRNRIVEMVREASENWGFFQIVNHGIPASTIAEMKAGVHRFFNLDVEAKKDFFGADPTPKVVYTGNSYTANWADLILFEMAPDPPKPEQIPGCIRDILTEYSGELFKLGDLLLPLLSEALGLAPSHLKDMDCLAGLGIWGHYYPICPQPELTLGVTQHTDIGFFTVLLQDHVGGLQVLHRDHWADLAPRSDALVVNIGDMLQLISNDKFKSVKHRVVLKKSGEPRVSIAGFFGYGAPPRVYGPIKDLLSKDNPPKYRETTIRDFFARSVEKVVDGESYLPQLKL